MLNNVKVKMLVAHGNSREIGRGNALPWSIPAEMRWFRENTQCPLIMGANTAKSLSVALKGRANIVVASDREDHEWFLERHFIVFDNLGAALTAATNMALRQGHEVAVIGGAKTYEAAMNFVDEIIVSHVDIDIPDADTFFPEIDLEKFNAKLIGDEHPALDGAPAWRVITYYKDSQHAV